MIGYCQMVSMFWIQIHLRMALEEKKAQILHLTMTRLKLKTLNLGRVFVYQEWWFALSMDIGFQITAS